MITLTIDAKDPAKSVQVRSEFVVRGDPLDPKRKQAILTVLANALDEMAAHAGLTERH